MAVRLANRRDYESSMRIFGVLFNKAITDLQHANAVPEFNRFWYGLEGWQPRSGAHAPGAPQAVLLARLWLSSNLGLSI